MENVVAFNNELSGLYDSKPPISKAKMAAITRAAMKAIKFYKHVVQSVEKFILKCKPEYKIPGLYVIDSIVRQSRHQYGAEKDVFAPRFARNMKQTFANLFRCASEDKSKIIRVLNLWQKNCVFAPEVIQPLFDFADPNHPIYSMQLGSSATGQDLLNTSNGMNTSGQDGGCTPNLADDTHGMSQDLSISHQQTPNTLDQNTIRQLQQLQQYLIRQTNEASAVSSSGATGGLNQSDSVKFNKKLLDYDYGDDEEDEKTASPHVTSNPLEGNNLSALLNDPNVLRQLQTLQKLKQQEEKQTKLNEMRIQEEAFEKQLQNVLKGNNVLPAIHTATNTQQTPATGHKTTNENEVVFVSEQEKIEVINLDVNDSRSPTPDRDRYSSKRRRESSRSRSRDRGGGGGVRDRNDRRRGRSSRSRSHSRSRSPRSSRRRSSRDRGGGSGNNNNSGGGGSGKDKDREKEKEREYERERRKKGIPDIKKEHLSVCSTTLWVGHLSKLVQQEELSDTFGKYGDIVSIDMIVPRGCAFIAMNRRQDAYKAMTNLKGHKMQGRAITISWATGKGVKSKEWKDYWDLDLGVSYIPWLKLTPTSDLDALEEGGMFDEDSMPDWMKQRLQQKKQLTASAAGIFVPNVDTSQPPPAAGGLIPGMPPPMMSQFAAMGGVPRLLPPPMGVPMTGNLVSGLSMPPNMVPGMPPPPPSLLMHPPSGMVPSGFPIPTQLDKSIPPPSSGQPSGNDVPGPGSFMHMAPLQHHQQPPPYGMPPFNQVALGGPAINLPPPLINTDHPGDDHMDIEMEDEPPLANSSKGGPHHLLPPPNFSQPPPLFPNFLNDENRRSEMRVASGGRDNRRELEFNSSVGRERNVDFGPRNERERSRWGNDRDRVRDRDSRDRGHRGNDSNNENRLEFMSRIPPGSDPLGLEGSNPLWQQENNGAANFQGPNFGNSMRGGLGGPNNMPIDLHNPPPHPRSQEFFELRREEFGSMDNRRGGNNQRDFFQNPNLRFPGPQVGPGASRGGGQMQIHGGAGPSFAPGLGGPMFNRVPRPGMSGPGFNNFNNDRPQFDREDRGGRRGGGGGNMIDRRGGGRNNWRDDDEDNRRGGGRFKNRNRDSLSKDRDIRERGDDRRNRDRGGRSGDRENRRKINRNDRERRFSKSEQEKMLADTEADWDKELSDHSMIADGSTETGEEQVRNIEQSYDYNQEPAEQTNANEDRVDEIVSLSIIEPKFHLAAVEKTPLYDEIPDAPKNELNHSKTENLKNPEESTEDINEN